MSKITIRPATLEDSAEIANVHISSWMESYKGLMPQTFLDDRPLNFKNRYTLWKRVTVDPTFTTLVAETSEHGVIGFINGKEARDEQYKDHAEVWCIYLLKKYHGQKIGFQMMENFFREMKLKNFNKAYLWVLYGNPTIKFYEKTGGKYAGHSKVETVANQQMTELCYVWENLDLGK
ncbi:MAG: GNAT family N-acetyltransferase [Rhizobacter sp.]|nr:GNAT family N-acetyltransferase [Bacteriovorax sp.]